MADDSASTASQASSEADLGTAADLRGYAVRQSLPLTNAVEEDFDLDEEAELAQAYLTQVRYDNFPGGYRRRLGSQTCFC